MTSAMIEPWETAVARNGIGISDMNALVVVRISFSCIASKWHEILRDLIFENFNVFPTILKKNPRTLTPITRISRQHLSKKWKNDD